MEVPLRDLSEWCRGARGDEGQKGVASSLQGAGSQGLWRAGLLSWGVELIGSRGFQKDGGFTSG